MHPKTLTNLTPFLTLTLLTLLTPTLLAAPIAHAEANLSPKVPNGASHFARSIPELIAERKAREGRAAVPGAKAQSREMGIW